MVTKRKKKQALKEYKVTLSTGEELFVRGRNWVDARDMVLEEKERTGAYGLHKGGVVSTHPVTQADREKYPAILKPKRGQWESGEENPIKLASLNPGAKWDRYYEGKYKILVNGKTVTEAMSLPESRSMIADMKYPDGTKIVVRYSKPEKRHLRGYFEPDQTVYAVEGGIPVLKWKKGGQQTRYEFLHRPEAIGRNPAKSVNKAASVLLPIGLIAGLIWLANRK